jgi:hypothetical protein
MMIAKAPPAVQNALSSFITEAMREMMRTNSGWQTTGWHQYFGELIAAVEFARCWGENWETARRLTPHLRGQEAEQLIRLLSLADPETENQDGFTAADGFKVQQPCPCECSTCTGCGNNQCDPWK